MVRSQETRDKISASKMRHGLLSRRHPKPPEFYAWCHMRRRCYDPKNPQYQNYGARGISVCERWRHDFGAFFADMGKRPSSAHSIDRVDVNGNYEPTNCRWATPKQQANNQRTNRLVTFNGETKTVAQWADQIGIKYFTLYTRLFRDKWPVSDALSGELRPFGGYR